MKKVLTSVLLLFAVVLSAAPEVLEGSLPLPEANPKSTRTRTNPLYVVTVLYRNLPYSVNSGVVLSELQKEYRKDGVRIFGVLFGDDPATVRRFASEHPEFDFTLASDPDLEKFSALTGRDNTISRASIVNADGKLLWGGDPVDLGMMLRRIMLDQYNERDEILMAELNTDLQAALRSGEAKRIEQAADRILAERPEQISALNAKAFALETLRDYPALAAFLKKRIRRYPAMPEAWYMLLDLACRVPELSGELPAAVRGCFRQFPQDYAMLNAVVWNLLNNAPASPDALKLAAEGLQLLRNGEKEMSPEQRSRCLASRALFSYRIGRIEQAVRLVGEAMESSSGAAEKAYLAALRNYFETALQLARQPEKR